MLYFSSSDFFQLFQKVLPGTLSVSNGLDPDQDRHVGPDLGPNCLQWLSAYDKVVASKERVKSTQFRLIE